MIDPPFENGEYVRLTAGKKPMVVLGTQLVYDRLQGTSVWMVQATYLTSLHWDAHMGKERRFRRATDFLRWDGKLEQKETAMADLYQTKEEKPRFGTMLTKNSAGHVVLEMKGEGGKVEAFSPDDIEIVLPYTVAIKGLGQTTNGGTAHLSAKEGDVKEGDILLEVETGSLWRVVGVNTKNRSPVNPSKRHFVRLSTESVSIGSDN